jgi:hypothetical protein
MPRGRRRGEESPVSFFSFQDVMMCTIGMTIISTLVLILQLGRSAAAERPAERAVTQPEAERRVESLRRARASLEVRVTDAELERSGDAVHRLGEDRSRIFVGKESLDRLRREQEEKRARLKAIVQASKADDRAIVAVELMERRDELQSQLRELNDRRRIVYLVAPSERLVPLVTEISSARVVVSADQSREGGSAIDGPDPDEVARRAFIALRSQPGLDRSYFLFVLKPSGIPVYQRLKALIEGDPTTKDMRIGLDLIPEDCWTNDHFQPAEGNAP